MENSNAQNAIFSDEIPQDEPTSTPLNWDEVEMVRLQFETEPYPSLPLDKNPQESPYLLFNNSLTTAHYTRSQRVVSSEGKSILDVGCGTGYTSLILATANPGSRIYGVDLSEKSVDLAGKRLAYHGFQNTEFKAMSIYDLPSLDLQFDYINCNDVLYFLPDQVKGLEAMKAVLKPDGIIRVNLHSWAQRFYIFQAQKLFTFMGLMEGPVSDDKVEIALSVIDAVKDDVLLKKLIWGGNSNLQEGIRSNALMQGDKGFSVADMFAFLEQSSLEFISMVEWRKWDLMKLFKEIDNLPPFLAISLPECSIKEQLQLFELLQPTNRLIDFWCGHEGHKRDKQPLEEWTAEQWQQATIHLHPVLRTEAFKEGLIASLSCPAIVDMTQYFPGLFQTSVLLDTGISSCLLALWDGGQTLNALVKRWLMIKPINPVTLEPISDQAATEEIQTFLQSLEALSCVLVDRP